MYGVEISLLCDGVGCPAADDKSRTARFRHLAASRSRDIVSQCLVELEKHAEQPNAAGERWTKIKDRWLCPACVRHAGVRDED